MSDPDCIRFDNEARDAKVYSIQAASAGDYHIRIEANDKATGETKEAHQIKIELLEPVDGYVPPTPDEDDTTPEPLCTDDEKTALEAQIAELQ